MRYINIPEIEEKYKCGRWRKTRELKFQQDPFCERCLKKGLYIPAYIAHHKRYITDENYMLDEVFYNLDNLESLCQPCHNQEHFSEEDEFIFDENGDLIKKD